MAKKAKSHIHTTNIVQSCLEKMDLKQHLINEYHSTLTVEGIYNYSKIKKINRKSHQKFFANKNIKQNKHTTSDNLSEKRKQFSVHSF